MNNLTLSPLALVNSFLNHRSTVWQMARREAYGKYRSSVLGNAWTILVPVMMLFVYTFVFSEVFNARWGSAKEESKLEFATILFGGLIVFNLFSETIGKAPNLIVSNPNFVTKIVFPLELLPVINLLAALFSTLTSALILLAFQWAITGRLPSTAALFPLVLLPLCILILGLSWFLSALGVYARDISQVVTIALTALMFLSPLFFPVSALGEKARWLTVFNPLVIPIEESRKVLIWNQLPDWTAWSLSLIACSLVSVLGYWWFQLTRKGFGDVL